ncbi:hypothetical protein KCU78_g642, partial [Aureobasidium melanogenum]
MKKPENSISNPWFECQCRSSCMQVSFGNVFVISYYKDNSKKLQALYIYSFTLGSSKKQGAPTTSSSHGSSTKSTSLNKASTSKITSSSTIRTSSLTSIISLHSLPSSSTSSASSSSFSSSSTSILITRPILTAASRPTSSQSSTSTTLDAYDVITSKGLEPFCSTYLGYTVPFATVTAIATATLIRSETIVTTTFISLTTTAIATEVDYSTTTTAITVTASSAATLSRRSRAFSIAIPDAISTYAENAISSACSRAVSIPATSTVTAQITQSFLVTAILNSTVTSSAVQTESTTTTEEATTTVTAISTYVPPSQVVVNPSFETTTAGSNQAPWSVSGQAVVESAADDLSKAYDGDYLVAIYGEIPQSTLSQVLNNVVIGSTYVLSYWYNVALFDTSGATVCTLSTQLDGAVVDSFVIPNTASETTYMQRTASWVADSAAPSLLVAFTCTGTEDMGYEITGIHLDDITLTKQQ